MHVYIYQLMHKYAASDYSTLDVTVVNQKLTQKGNAPGLKSFP